MSDQSKQIAVITGDLVNSSALGSEKIERAMAALADCAEVQAEWHGDSLRFTRHRGDGWQVVLAKPQMALRSTLAFRAALRALGSEFDSYMALATGPAEYEIGTNLNEQTSEVFSVSGRMLEQLKGNKEKQRFNVQNDRTDAATFILSDYISGNWTAKQAETILRTLDPAIDPTYEEIAQSLGKTRQAVKKSLDGAAGKQLLFAIRHAEGRYQSD